MSTNFEAQFGTGDVFDNIQVDVDGNFAVNGPLVSPAFIDFDGDGDLDLVIGKGGGYLDYVENIGDSDNPIYENVLDRSVVDSEPFTEQGPGADFNAKSVLFDVNEDGDVDIVVGGGNGGVRYFENTSDSSGIKFNERFGIDNPFSGFDVDSNAAIEFEDLDGDGDLDAAVGSGDGTIGYYERITGSIPYVERTGENNPFANITVGANATPALADIDGDGDLDLTVGNAEGTLNYYENVGDTSTPVFAERTGSDNPFHGLDVGDFSDPTFADIDGDGTLELIVGDGEGKLNDFEEPPTPEGITLEGTNKKDVLIGTDGNDTLNGNNGKDILEGGAGDDILEGGRGKDLLTGGSGADLFIIGDKNDGKDTITDFEVGVDSIGVSDSLSFEDLTLSGNDISFKGNVLAILNDVDVTTLSEDDFTFV